MEPNKPAAFHSDTIPFDARIKAAFLTLVVMVACRAWGGTHYVDPNNSNPVPPFTSWATAATNIQQAIAAASVGAEIIVTNGIYASGETVFFGETNRVVVDKPLTLRSVNGPAFTAINGSGAVRCLYLTNGASLLGFTLSNGFAMNSIGGGVSGGWTNSVVSNCVLNANLADVGGGAYGCILLSCTLSNNVSYYEGGGAEFCVLTNCTLTRNSAGYSGGGTAYSVLDHCVISTNTVLEGYGYGGGAFFCEIYNSLISGNRADNGGGAYGYTSAPISQCIFASNSARIGGALFITGGASITPASRCTFVGNSADPDGSGEGGAAYGGYFDNCLFVENSAAYAGGVSGGVLNNCTLTDNKAFQAGGAWSTTLRNCIVYFNSANFEPNSYSCDFSYSCTTPLPESGVGNISVDPQLAGTSHLSAASPCRGAGSSAYSTGTDIDGETWSNPPSIGCDEYHVESVTGPLSVAITIPFTTVATNYELTLTGSVEGIASVTTWDFGDGATATNRPFDARHSWATPGDYSVVFSAVNGSHPAGVGVTQVVHVVSPVHYVSAASANPLPPYASWATAASRIQDAVDAATVPGALVLVTNGIYSSGSGLYHGTNRVAANKVVNIRSVNGPQYTVIDGAHVMRCVSLTNFASLSGFTLINGTAGDGGGVYFPEFEYSWASQNPNVTACVICSNSASYRGAGAFGCVLQDCLLVGNSATQNGVSGGGAYGGVLSHCLVNSNSADYGGGAHSASLFNCSLSGNSAASGGGAFHSTLNGCTITSNSISFSGYGGGVSWSKVKNCIVDDNVGLFLGQYLVDNYVDGDGGSLDFCCTTLLPGTGMGNFTNAPMFVDQAGGNFRLQSNSPCINSGNNAAAAGGTDLDGNPRVIGGTVDVGAYEFQNPGSTISYAWLQTFGLPTDGSADDADSDGDGMSNFREWRVGTAPTSSLSALRMISTALSNNVVRVTWQSAPNITYLLERGTNLDFFAPVATNIPSQGATTIFLDTNAVGQSSFYRVGVR